MSLADISPWTSVVPRRRRLLGQHLGACRSGSPPFSSACTHSQPVLEQDRRVDILGAAAARIVAAPGADRRPCASLSSARAMAGAAERQQGRRCRRSSVRRAVLSLIRRLPWKVPPVVGFCLLSVEHLAGRYADQRDMNGLRRPPAAKRRPRDWRSCTTSRSAGGQAHPDVDQRAEIGNEFDLVPSRQLSSPGREARTAISSALGPQRQAPLCRSARPRAGFSDEPAVGPEAAGRRRHMAVEEGAAADEARPRSGRPAVRRGRAG